MITVVSGKLGSGKSFDCARLIIRHLSRGGAVRTNMALDLDAISRRVGRRISAYQYGLISAATEPSEIPRGDFRGLGKRRTLIVLDEALNWFDSATSKEDNLKSTWGRWLRQSDKLGQDVFFIAQNFERAAKWIRELAQVSREIIPVRGVKVFGFVPIGLLVPFGSRLYMVSCRDVRSGSSIGAECHFYTSGIWSCYSTSETYGFRASSSAYPSGWVPPFNPPIRFLFLLLPCLAFSLFCASGRLDRKVFSFSDSPKSGTFLSRFIRSHTQSFHP